MILSNKIIRRSEFLDKDVYCLKKTTSCKIHIVILNEHTELKIIVRKFVL